MIPSRAAVIQQRIWALAPAALGAGLAATVATGLLPGAWRVAVSPVVAAALFALVYRWFTAATIRRRRLADRGLDEAQRRVLENRVRPYARLDDERKRRCEQLCAILLDEIRMVGVGCELTDEDRLLIAVSAAIPILGFTDWEYEGLREVLVYPRSFVDPTQAGGQAEGDACGMVYSGDGLLESMVLLSLPELRRGYARDDDHYNVGLHEFAHLIDRADGCVDGVPAGLPRDRAAEWLALTAHELAEPPSRSIIRPYGHTNRQEFFAVASEFFFEDPELLKAREPQLYDLLVAAYHWDPLETDVD